ncbi:MAG: GntR family transcriptional regulator [Pseudomonadota bacterium]
MPNPTKRRAARAPAHLAQAAASPLSDTGAPKTRARAIEDALEHQIISGALPPGARLNEIDLAEKFSASRTPVREALQRLASKSLVTIESGRGAFVAKPDVTALLQMFEALSELEGVCARLCARRITSKEFKEMERVHEGYADEANSDDIVAYYDKSVVFHELVTHYAKNQVLEKMSADLNLKLAPYRIQTLEHPKRIEKSIAEHTLVLDAIRRNDENDAEQFMRAHTGLVTDNAMRLIRLLDQKAEPPS